MCKYCETVPREWLIKKSFEDDAGFGAYLRFNGVEGKNYLVIHYHEEMWDFNEKIEVSYCPVCGRKLMED